MERRGMAHILSATATSLRVVSAQKFGLLPGRRILDIRNRPLLIGPVNLARQSKCLFLRIVRKLLREGLRRKAEPIKREQGRRPHALARQTEIRNNCTLERGQRRVDAVDAGFGDATRGPESGAKLDAIFDRLNSLSGDIGERAEALPPLRTDSTIMAQQPETGGDLTN